MAKKSIEAERKARVEEMRKAQQAAERRRTMLVVGSAGVVVAVLIGVVIFVVRDSVADNDVANVGQPASAASCDPVITDVTKGTSVHVGPGTDQADKVTVKYDTVPPSSGEHYAQPEYPSRAFYTADDRPRMENLVHNLEHGYTIVWYDPTLPAADTNLLKRIADLSRKDDNTAGKFIVSAWDDAYGKLPAGKTVAISHWGAKSGFRQMCGGVSGDAIKAFTAAHPYSDSPEPSAA